MAIKKSDLYSSLWASCDELRGGMDASLYKDYVLFMLFIKYITDKYGNSDDFAPPITIPTGASFNASCCPSDLRPRPVVYNAPAWLRAGLVSVHKPFRCPFFPR